MCGNTVGVEGIMPVKYGSVFRAVPGYELKVLSDEQQEMPPGELGNLVIKLPLPPGCLMTLYNRDDLFLSAYMSQFPGYYCTGDAGYIDQDGYVFVMTRVDDVINVAGHRLSTGSMEEILATHPEVAEVAVLGVTDDMKGQIPVAFAVLNEKCTVSHADIEKQVVAMVREAIGAVACFKKLVVVRRLPKTRSGKILRGTMRKIANGEVYQTPGTMEDVTVLAEIELAINMSKERLQ